MIENFSESGLDPQILKAIEDLGFVEPTPIQIQTLPYILNEEKDLIAMAQTGTGKTAAFGLPLIQLTNKESKSVQSLILCPTRELCIQITTDLGKFIKYTPQVKVIAVYGGASIETQIKALKKGAHFVVGTPGRTLDLIKRKVLKVTNIKWLVLDEADEMLNMGFKEDLDAILEGTPKDKRTFLFSATMPKEIAQMAKNYMSSSERISVGKQNAGAENVKHEYFMVHARDRFEALKRITDVHPKIYGIIFCRTRQETKEVAAKLMNGGYNADALHGDLSQSQRSYVMSRFRSKQLQLLVATDVAARGLDVENLSHVVNYNLPDDLEVYIHRSGRTGRAGNKGVSIAIVHTRENSKIRQLEKMANIKFERKMVPTGKEICEKQLYTLIDKIERVDTDNSQIEQFLPAIYNKLEWLSREELIKHIVSVEFNQFLKYYKNAPDLNVSESRSPIERKGKKGVRGERSTKNERPGRGDKRKHNRGESGESGYTRFYINLGAKKGVDVQRLIGLVNESTKNRNIPIGKIDIMKKFSFFEVESRYAGEVKAGFSKFKFEGSGVLVEESKPDVNSYREKPQEKKRKTRKKGNRQDFHYNN